MKQIKCTLNNGYNITIGNTYNLLQESQDFYWLVNDNQKTVKYGKNMFELIEDEIIPEPIPVVQRTEADMVDSVTISGSTLSYINLDNNIVNFSVGLEENDTNISCGIGQLSGINSLVSIINSRVPQDDDYIDLRKELLRKYLISNAKSNDYRDENAAMWLISTAIKDIDEDMISVLDEVADTVSEVKNNPNSGNDIKMWIFYTN